MITPSPGFRRGFTRGVSALTMAAAATSVGVGGWASQQAVEHNTPGLGTSSEHWAGGGSHLNDDKPVNVPRWTQALSRQFEGYHDVATRPKDTIASSVVVVGNDSRARTMSYDQAHARSQDSNKANDVWTVGYR